MQSPTVIFDHINNVMTTVPSGAAQNKQISDVLEGQRTQVSTASGIPAARG